MHSLNMMHGFQTERNESKIGTELKRGKEGPQIMVDAYLITEESIVWSPKTSQKWKLALKPKGLKLGQ